MNPLEDFANGLRQLGHRVQNTDTQALVDGRYLVTWRYPQFRVYVRGAADWALKAEVLTMREAYRVVTRG